MISSLNVQDKSAKHGGRLIDVISNIIPVILYLKHYFSRAFRHWYVVAVECAISTVFLLFDCHREFLEGFILIPRFPKDSSQLPCKRLLVSIPCEECDRFPSLPTTSCRQGRSSLFRPKTIGKRTCSSDPVYIILNRQGKRVIYDRPDIRNIQSTRSNISGHQKSCLPILKIFKCLHSCSLGHVTVERTDRITVPLQHLLDSPSLFLVQGEHECAGFIYTCPFLFVG